jgi:hypothetical protein
MRQDGVEGVSRARRLAAGLGLALALVQAGPAWADDYDPLEAGHPLRILAYVAHPVGWLLDVAIMRPAHWLGHLPGLREVFGHTD